MAPNRIQRRQQGFEDKDRLWMVENDLDENEIAIARIFEAWEKRWDKWDLQYKADMSDINKRFDRNQRMTNTILGVLSGSCVLLALNVIVEVAK